MLKLTPQQKQLWIEDSLAMFKEFTDPFTKWVHLCYEDSFCKSTIPLFENGVNLLALLRSHHIESLSEIVKRLSDLLQFQNENGSFPCYFHERGHARHSTSVMMILPLSLIWHYYIQLFPAEEKKKIENSLTSLMAYLSSFEISSLDKLCIQIGRFVFFREAVERSFWDLQEFRSLREVSQYFLFMQLLATLDNEEIKNHLSHTMQKYWYKEVYVGPLWEERTHDGQIPGHFFDFFLQQSKEPSSLIYAPLLISEGIPSIISKLAPSVSYQGVTWQLFEKQGAIIHAINHFDPKSSVSSPFMQLLRIVFSKEQSLSFFPSDYKLSISCQDKVITLSITWQGEEKEGEEVSFFITKKPTSHWDVQGSLATTFMLDEVVNFHLENHRVSIRHQIMEGHAEILGMISRGGRACNEKKTFQGSDWVVSIRPQYRTETLSYKIEIILEECGGPGNQQQVPLHEDHCQHKGQHL